MATIEECRAALQSIAGRLAGEPGSAPKIDLDRSIACHIRDLDAYFHGRLKDGSIQALNDGDDPKAQIRLAMAGDDLLALVRGDLHFASAWATGRVSIKASFGDLLMLRKLG